MRNVEPKQYELRFYRFVFTLLIQMILLMAVATVLFMFAGENAALGFLIAVGYGAFAFVIIRTALTYVRTMQLQLEIELKTIYGIELKKEMEEEINAEDIEEEEEKKKEGGITLGEFFGRV